MALAAHFARLYALLRGLGRSQLPLLLWLCVLAAAAWGFLELADAVVEGDARSVDEAILLAMRDTADARNPVGPAWLEEIGRDITALGGVAVLSLISVAAAGYLLLSGHYRDTAFMSAAILGGWLLSTLLKLGFARPRPELISHEAVVYTASFPSGHSMMAAVTYLTLGVMLGRVHADWKLKVYLLLVATTLTVLVGISRIYLGVHWPTDVLAGWAAGAGWASLCWLLALWMQRRGAIDRACGGDTAAAGGETRQGSAD